MSKRTVIPEAPFEEPYQTVDVKPTDVKPTGEVPSDEPQKRRNRSGVVEVLSGNVLANKRMRRQYTFFLYCCLLIILYMGYLFACQRAQRNEVQAKIALQNARSASLVNATRRIEASSHGKIVDEVTRRHLRIKEWNIPPKEIAPYDR
ncbi:MAG: FtsL-like putative cell division protein [Tidjanibacter sp.]|nr:FtsL-like putative cell division protein [Tidjanibacter sp.]